MKIYTIILLSLFSLLSFSQVNTRDNKSQQGNENLTKSESKPTAAFDQYRIITPDKDTTYVDTTLSIQKEYRYNYLRKDLFGLLPFANEGQPYTVLDFGNQTFSAFPKIGFTGKHANYIEADAINYYSVATPLTDLYFKTVMEQGQSLDAFITLNTSERFNFSIAYKGLRSLGKYINQLSSAGHFRFTGSYQTMNNRYAVDFHITGQDMLNGENGGLTNTNDFENENINFDNRARFEVYLRDAKTVLKGKRFFANQQFRLNAVKGNDNLYLTHQFNYENKFFEYNQQTVPSTVLNTTVYRFGDAYVDSNINDQTRFNRLHNKVGAVYENAVLGKFQFFAEDFRYNYFYDQILVLDSNVIPALLHDQINTIGGRYAYQKQKWDGSFSYSNSLTDHSLVQLEAQLKYTVDSDNQFLFHYQNLNRLPNQNYNLYQSSYVHYNWSNDFKNEKINLITAQAKTQWLDASLQLSSFDDFLYFSNDSNDPQQQLISPKQYGNTIHYLSVKIGKEFRFRDFALDNTVLYQETDQQDAILNVPKIVTRNTLYYSNHFFKKALYLQTGIIFNYFTKYYANDYNPVTAEFFVQQQKQIGNFPMLDFFVNGKIRQTRIFIKAEHFNSSFTGNTFYNAPNYPYRDFMIRFGLVWNFFQ